MGDMKPQDENSGLVNRAWQRLVGKSGKPDRRGVMTETTLEGEQVEAQWLDEQGQLQHEAGTVVRNGAGDLAIESWADGIRRERTVPRDANVSVAAWKR